MSERLLLREHQERALTKLQRYFVERRGAQSARGQFISACGSGKTVTSAYFIEVSGAKLVTFLVPNLNLVSQTWEAYHRQFGDDFTGFIICSDDQRATVEKVDSDDLLGAQASDDMTDDEIAQAWGGQVLRDPREIGAALDQAAAGDKLTVVFSTYQSVHHLIAGMKRSQVQQLDLALYDEAHFLASEKPSKEREKMLRDVLTRLPVRQRLFMTATPKFTNSKWSMNNTQLFGPAIEWYSYQDAVADGVVAEFDIYVCQVDRERDETEFLRQVRQQFSIKETLDANLAISHSQVRSLAVATALAQHIQAGTITRALTYSNSSKMLRQNARDINAVLGEDKARPLWYASKTAERKAGIDDLVAGKINVITNCNLFTEGHDTPDLDAIAFVDPRSSATQIVQAIGRACRLPENRPGKRAKIIVPVDDFDYDQTGALIHNADGSTRLSGEHGDTPFSMLEAVLAAMKHPGLNLVDAAHAISEQVKGHPRPPRRDVPSITESSALEDLEPEELGNELIPEGFVPDGNDAAAEELPQRIGIRDPQEFERFLAANRAPAKSSPVRPTEVNIEPRVFVSTPFSGADAPRDIELDESARIELVAAWVKASEVADTKIQDSRKVISRSVEEEIRALEGIGFPDLFPAVKLYRAYEQLANPILRQRFADALPKHRTAETEVDGKIMYSALDRRVFSAKPGDEHVRNETRLLLADAVRIAIFAARGDDSDHVVHPRVSEKAVNAITRWKAGTYPRLSFGADQAFRYATAGRGPEELLTGRYLLAGRYLRAAA